MVHIPRGVFCIISPVRYSKAIILHETCYAVSALSFTEAVKIYGVIAMI